MSDQLEIIGGLVVSGTIDLGNQVNIPAAVQAWGLSYNPSTGQVGYMTTASYSSSFGGYNVAGTTGQIQYNNLSAFGGVPTLTYDGTRLRATGSFSGSYIGSFTGSLSGTSSFATSASWAPGTTIGGSNNQIQFNRLTSFAGTGSFLFTHTSQSFVQGLNATASGIYSRAHGELTVARGRYSHAEGYESDTQTTKGYAGSTITSNIIQLNSSYGNLTGFLFSNTRVVIYALNDGSKTYTALSGYVTFSGGSTFVTSSATLPGGNVVLYAAESTGDTSIPADYSHAEGYFNSVIGDFAHSEGGLNTSVALGSHTEGYSNESFADYSHAEGSGTTTYAPYSHTEGAGTITYGTSSHAEGYLTTTYGHYSHAEGGSTSTSGDYSHAEGFESSTTGQYSHAEGFSTQTLGNYSHTEGINSTTISEYAHAEGESTITYGRAVHTEGYFSNAYGNWSHAEGNITITNGEFSHAEGSGSITYGSGSHAEGQRTTTRGDYSHTEGLNTVSSGSYSHAEGSGTQAIGNFSHAEGLSTEARGNYSNTKGNQTVALGDHQLVIGQFNISSSQTAAFIIGNGTSDSNRRNLLFASGSEMQITGSLLLSGSIATRFTTASAAYTASISDSTIDLTGNVTASLYSVVGNTGRQLVIKNGGTGIITVDPSGSQTIDGQLTRRLAARESLLLQSDGVSDWLILNKTPVVLLYGHGSTGISLAANTTYYIGQFFDADPSTSSTSLNRTGIALSSGWITRVTRMCSVASTLSGTEDSTLSIRNVTTNTTVTVSSTIEFNVASQLEDFTLSTPLSVTRGDQLQVVITTGNWITAPNSVRQYFNLLIE